MKVVLDTNVLVAAFAARGLCEAVFVVCLERHDRLISEHILKELRRHLTGTLKIPAKQAQPDCQLSATVRHIGQSGQTFQKRLSRPGRCTRARDCRGG